MNINLVYEGKNYNFDIPNNVTIDYLKELSSKIFNSDKALLDLVYKNQKFQINDDNTLIRDLIPNGENNAILTVKINKSENSPKKGEPIPLATLKSKKLDSSEKKELKKINESLNMEKSNIKAIKNIKLFKEKSENKSMDKKDTKSGKLLKNNKFGNRNIFMINNSKSINLINKDFDAKIFESTFIKKNKELLSLMKEFNSKIKEVYLSLYKKFKNAGVNNININYNNYSSLSNNSSISSNSNGINNNYFYELTIYEKKLIDFEDKQIKYYRRLLELIQKYYQNEDFSKLNEFFTNLFIFGINNIKDNTSESIRLIKLKKLLNNNNNNNSSLGNSSSKNINKSLPPLNFKNNNSSFFFDKKNKSINMNNSNIYGINSAKNNNNISANNQIGSEDEKEKSKKINSIDDRVKKPDPRRSSLIVESKLSINNINKDDNKSVNNSANNFFEKNNNEPSPLQIRKAPTSSTFINLKNRKFSVISDKINNMNINEQENNDNGYMKRLLNNNLSSSLIYRNSPKKVRRIIIERNSPGRLKKKVMNESLNENALLNKRKIIDINVSSMTVNDSNFIRDKRSSPKKKLKKDINKYDFFM